MDTEELLRGHFADQALDSPAPAPDLLHRAFARQRARRRRVAVAGGVAVACTAVVVALVPVLAQVGGPAPVGQVAAPAGGSLLDTPPRGSLAGDPAFTSALLAAPWAGGRPEQRQVAFVGDVPGGRWALVVGVRDDAVVGQWFTGPADATPGELTPDTSRPDTQEGGAFARLEPTAPTSPLVVVPGPGQSVEVSQRAVVAADGSVARDYQPVPTTDGVAVIQVDGQTREGTESAARYRLVTDGRAGPSVSLSTSGGVSTFAPPELTPLRSSGGTPSPEAVDKALTQVGAPTGVEDAELAPELLWAGPATNGGQTVDVAVVVATLPSGALAVSTAWSQIAADGSGTVGTCGTQLLPAGTSVEDIVVAAACAGVPGAAGSAYLLSVPAGDHQLTLSAGTGTADVVTLDDRTVLRTDLPAGLTTAEVRGPSGDSSTDIARPSPADVFELAGE